MDGNTIFTIWQLNEWVFIKSNLLWLSICLVINIYRILIYWHIIIQKDLNFRKEGGGINNFLDLQYYFFKNG